MGLHQSGKRNPKNIKREFENFQFCQVVTFASLWSHNLYIKFLIEEFLIERLSPIKKTFQCHITCLIESSFE